MTHRAPPRVTEAALAVANALEVQEARYRELTAVQLLCSRSSACSAPDAMIARAPQAMREALANVVKTQDDCLKQTADAWRAAMTAVTEAFLELLRRCAVDIQPSSAGAGLVELPDAAGRQSGSFHIRNVEWLRLRDDGTWCAYVRITNAAGNSSRSEELSYRDGKLVWIPD